MKTLIELYDERPLENVLGTEMFRPERTVFICPPEVAQNATLKRQLRAYFEHRGLDVETVFIEASLLDADKLEAALQRVIDTYPDCAMDIAGGTDTALFAAGRVSVPNALPVFTWSRKRNLFFNVMNAPYAHRVACDVRLSVEDCFLMAGGAARMGRVDNAVLTDYEDLYAPFFEVFMKHRVQWPHIVTYIQRLSQPRHDEAPGLTAAGPYEAKGEHGSRIECPREALRALERLGMIRGLSVDREEGVSFAFRDMQVRTWLRDVGSVLELAVWKACLDSGAYQDVRTSVVVDWAGAKVPDGVTNEIDVMTTRGVTPVFISCKVCDVRTEALNELAILRDRFGSGIARAAIVTAEPTRAVTRHRAEELGIDVIDLEDLQSGAWKALLGNLAD